MNRLSAVAALAILLSACAAPTQSPPTTSLTPSSSPQPTGTSAPSTTSAPAATPISEPRPPVGDVTLVTHDSFAASDEVIADFGTSTGGTLHVLKGGDAGTMVNQAILTKDAPLGDVLYGVDNTFLSRALDAGIFDSYTSPTLQSIPAEFPLAGDFRVTPIDYGDVCINYDKDAFATATTPATVKDLTESEHKSQLVVENPATSSPGLAFMLATIVQFGESGDYTWLDYWRELKVNDVLVVPDWNSAYYNEFSGGAGAGDRPLVVSYATSPAAEVYFSDPQPAVSPTSNVDDGCFRQVEYAGVLHGAKNAAGAQAWIRFMSSPEFQSDMPLNMFVFPVNQDAEVPDLFTQFPSKATAPLTMDPATIAANRDTWIQQWTDAVLH